MKRTATLLMLVGLVLVGAGCSGSDAGGAGPPSTVGQGGVAGSGGPSTTTTAGGRDTTTAPATAGRVLKPGRAPLPWAKAKKGTALTFASLGKADASASAVTCPTGVPSGPGISTGCTVFQDEGGAYAGLSVRTSGSLEQTTLLCQKGDDPTFTPSLTIEGRVAMVGPGAVGSGGRAFSALAIETADGVHWFAIRRPAGERCPVVWDLGLDDGTLKVASSVGGATYPLVTGPTCAALVKQGLEVKPATAKTPCP